jgi:hypothetical protein
MFYNPHVTAYHTGETYEALYVPIGLAENPAKHQEVVLAAIRHADCTLSTEAIEAQLRAHEEGCAIDEDEWIDSAEIEQTEIELATGAKVFVTLRVDGAARLDGGQVYWHVSVHGTRMEPAVDFRVARRDAAYRVVNMLRLAAGMRLEEGDEKDERD